MLINIDLNVNIQRLPTSKGVSCGPKMTAFQSMMLFSPGAPDTPAGGSSWVWQIPWWSWWRHFLGEEITQINLYNWWEKEGEWCQRPQGDLVKRGDRCSRQWVMERWSWFLIKTWSLLKSLINLRLAAVVILLFKMYSDDRCVQLFLFSASVTGRSFLRTQFWNGIFMTTLSKIPSKAKAKRG